MYLKTAYRGILRDALFCFGKYFSGKKECEKCRRNVECCSWARNKGKARKP